jgi:hypothetical protein
MRQPYSASADEKTFLLTVRPGDYIVGGVDIGIMNSCMCLGTVKFTARPGVITDLGYVLTAREDKPITVPELAGYERQIDYGIVPFAMTVRPPTPASSIPSALQSLPRVSVEYSGFGPFPNYFGALVERMAPVPGILQYDRDGRVLSAR